MADNNEDPTEEIITSDAETSPNEVAPAIEITGKVEDTQLSPGALAAKDIEKGMHPELEALIEKGPDVLDVVVHLEPWDTDQRL